VPVSYRFAETLPHSYLRTIHFCRPAAAEFAAVCDALARALGSTPTALGSTTLASTTLMAG